MRHSRAGILWTLLAALAVSAANASSVETNDVAEVDPGVFLTTYLKEKFVRLTGTIHDIVDDDLDAQWHFIVLNARHSTIYCPIRDTPRKALSALIGAHVSIVGTQDVYNLPYGRRLLGNKLYVNSLNDITVLAPPPQDPFAAKRETDMRYTSVAVDTHFLGRVKMVGKVLAAWDWTHFLLRRDDGLLSKVESIDDAPPANAWVETVGTAESDLFNVNLLQAVWRPTENGDITVEAVTNTTAKAILENELGQHEISHGFYGRAIRLRGSVRSVLEKDGRVTAITIEDEGYLIAVRVSNIVGPIPATPADSTIAVTGICVFDIDNWYPNAPFPYVKGFFVVPQTAEDIVVVSRPSWWTPGKLLAVIGTLLAALIGFFVWNRALRILVEQRGRQLRRKQLQAVRSELKFLERSNLAVELHDAISQYLTAIALELRTVNELADGLADDARRHLSVASKTLASCRDELRNCLWDLRHNTLEIKELAETIRMTVSPHIGAARLIVRFDVARKLLSENLAHTVLQITRELAANAVRHGNATEIWIDGDLDGNLLSFTVRDNGYGFVPEAVPGMEEGHFGLLGVRERTEKFEGTLEIESAPGKGACITVGLLLKNEES